MAMGKKGASLAWLRELMIIQGCQSEADGMGGAVRAWQDRAHVWAHVNQSGANRLRVYVRRGVNLSPPFRVLWQGIPYRVEGNTVTETGSVYKTFIIVPENMVFHG